MIDICDFTEQDVIAIRSFLSLAFYNGYEDDVLDIKNALYVVDNVATRPEHWDKKVDYKIDDFGGIFWSWLVLQYGDYGTSPRFGWIYEENARRLYAIINEWLEEK